MPVKQPKKLLILNIPDILQKYSDEDDVGVTVTAFTNEMAMEQFALNFAPDVTVLEPRRLREKVKSALEKALKKYD
jgi:predicted DNA-binding transcriptional regulator YafY